MQDFGPITGEFRDRRLERDFRAAVLPEVQRNSRLTLVVAALLTAMFIASDFTIYGSAWPFPLLVACRLTIVVTCLVLAVVLHRSRALIDRAWIYSIASLAVATGIFVVAAFRPPETLPTQLTAAAIVAMACYLFAPNVMRGMLFSALYLSIGFLIGAWYWADASPSTLLIFLLLLVLANVVGYFAARRLALLQRSQFALLAEERHFRGQLEDEVRRREGLERQLRELAQTDGLTGLSNRRHLIELAGAALAEANRDGDAFSLAMIDVDHFKRINDTHGHGFGDRVLLAVADSCRSVFGADVPIGRFGGEEFVVVLPGRDIAAATIAAERLRAEVAELRLDGAPEGFRVTVTAGVAARRPEMNLDAILALADDALYEGKRRGRNAVIAGGSP